MFRQGTVDDFQLDPRYIVFIIGTTQLIDVQRENNYHNIDNERCKNNMYFFEVIDLTNTKRLQYAYIKTKQGLIFSLLLG